MVSLAAKHQPLQSKPSIHLFQVLIIPLLFFEANALRIKMSSISIFFFLTQIALGIHRTSMPFISPISQFNIVNLNKSCPIFIMKDHPRLSKSNKKCFLFRYNPIVIECGCSLCINPAITPFFANNQDGKLYKIDASYIKISENQIQHSILFLPLRLLYYYPSFCLKIQAEGRARGFKLSKMQYS